MLASSQCLELGAVQGDRALVGGDDMLAALQRPTTERRRRFSVHRVGEGGFNNNVRTGILDHRFIEGCDVATRQLRQCTFDCRQLGERIGIQPFAANHRAEKQVSHTDDFQGETQFCFPLFVTIGNQLSQCPVNTTKANQRQFVFSHFVMPLIRGMGCWALG
ncbi:hypothetical protein D3C78_1381570 [compost metagenome]